MDPVTGSEALHRFEHLLIPVRVTAGNVAAREAWEREWLSDPSPAHRQGFEAGYDAAMATVRRLLVEVQSEALRKEVINLRAERDAPYGDH